MLNIWSYLAESHFWNFYEQSSYFISWFVIGFTFIIGPIWLIWIWIFNPFDKDQVAVWVEEAGVGHKNWVAAYFSFSHHYIFRVVLVFFLIPFEEIEKLDVISEYIQGIILACLVPIVMMYHIIAGYKDKWERFIQMAVWIPLGFIFLSNLLINKFVESISGRQIWGITIIVYLVAC